MSYFHFDEKKIYYKEFGTGEPLLFLHGNTASSNMFLELAIRYQKDFQVILIDFLGHGKSDRLNEFPTDLWFYEAKQVIAFLKMKQYGKVNIIGTSGGALVAINVGLEAPELVHKIIADSFEGERSIPAFAENIAKDREASKQDPDARMFYYYMHSKNWEPVVDQDTRAIARHHKEIGQFFHKELSNFIPDLLLTGSREDEFIASLDSHYFEKVYGAMIDKIGHGEMVLFETGRHPALLSNADFYQVSCSFLKKK